MRPVSIESALSGELLLNKSPAPFVIVLVPLFINVKLPYLAIRLTPLYNKCPFM